MFKTARYGAVAFTFLGPALLSGCGAPSQPAQAANATTGSALASAAPTKAVRTFTLDTPVSRIAADPNGRAVLDRDIPGVMASKEYPLFDDMSLTQIAMMSGGRLTKSQLDVVQTDLVQLPSLSQ